MHTCLTMCVHTDMHVHACVCPHTWSCVCACALAPVPTCTPAHELVCVLKGTSQPILQAGWGSPAHTLAHELVSRSLAAPLCLGVSTLTLALACALVHTRDRGSIILLMPFFLRKTSIIEIIDPCKPSVQGCIYATLFFQTSIMLFRAITMLIVRERVCSLSCSQAWVCMLIHLSPLMHPTWCLHRS